MAQRAQLIICHHYGVGRVRYKILFQCIYVDLYKCKKLAQHGLTNFLCKQECECIATTAPKQLT